MKKLILFLFLVLFIYSYTIASPVLVEPPKGQTMVTVNPVLTWTNVNAAFYIVDVNTQPDFSGAILNINNQTSDTFIVIPPNVLQSNTTYYWRVTSLGIGGSSTSDVFNFRTVGTSTQELGHVTDDVNGLVTSNILPANQGNILNNRLQATSHQVDLGHPFVAIVDMLTFKLRVLILTVSNILPQSKAQSLQTSADGIINLIANGNYIIPPLAELQAHSFNLTQNYPNPFNPATNIEYTIPEKTHVTLKIYDMLGKEVSTLVDKEQDAGTYVTLWNATKFSSGVYFYRITAGSNVQTKKMILNK